VTPETTSTPTAPAEDEISLLEVAKHARHGCSRCGGQGYVIAKKNLQLRDRQGRTHAHLDGAKPALCPCALKRWTKAEEKKAHADQHPALALAREKTREELTAMQAAQDRLVAAAHSAGELGGVPDHIEGEPEDLETIRQHLAEKAEG
jgi:hypothetical protein